MASSAWPWLAPEKTNVNRPFGVDETVLFGGPRVTFSFVTRAEGCFSGDLGFCGRVFPVVPFYRFFLGEGSTKIHHREKKRNGTLIPTSLLEDPAGPTVVFQGTVFFSSEGVSLGLRPYLRYGLDLNGPLGSCRGCRGDSSPEPKLTGSTPPGRGKLSG